MHLLKLSRWIRTSNFYRPQEAKSLSMNSHTGIKERGTLSPRLLIIIGSQTECTDLDCESRKSDSALPNIPFFGTYRLMESRRDERDSEMRQNTLSDSLKSAPKDESFIRRMNHRKSVTIDILARHPLADFFTFLTLGTISRERT